MRGSKVVSIQTDLLKRAALLLVAVAVLSGVYTAKAECRSSGTPACDDVTITKIYVSNNGTVYIDTSGDETNLSYFCTPIGQPGNTYIKFERNQTGADFLMSAILMAHTTGSPILIRMGNGNTTGGDCQLAYVTMEKP